MKKLFIFCAFALLTGCNLGKNQYSYIEIVESPTNGIIQKTPTVFYSENDSLAYNWAMEHFMVSKRIYGSLNDENVQQVAQVPLSFVLEDKVQRRIYRGDNKIAFKTALFGMNRKDVESLNLFDEGQSKLNIGNVDFSINMDYTKNDSLYWVDVRSESYDWADYYNKVRPLSEKMFEYLKNDLGYPTFVNKMPSRNTVENAETIWPIYIWDMYHKYVVVAIDCQWCQNKPFFYVTTRIIDKKTWLSLFNNDTQAAENAYWSKMGVYAHMYYQLEVNLRKIDGSW